jgi:hypothetical protein
MTSEAHTLRLAVAAGLYALLLSACAFAIMKGRAAERLGAMLYLASVLFDVVVGLAIGKSAPIVPMLMFDALVAVGYLALAIRYNNLWVGAVMMLKGVQLAFHATHLTDEADAYVGAWNIYILGLNTICGLMSLTLIFATVSSIRQRIARKAEMGVRLGPTSPA